MKTIKLNTTVKNIILGALTTMILFSFNSCARKVSFLTSSVVPAARGYVKLKKDNNKNYVIQIHLYNLAEVTRLQPSKQAYVVWMINDKETSINIGQINSSTGLLSKSLTAYFETVSSSKPIKIFITAEDNANNQNPGNMVILSTDRF
ncbi:MAG: hypothetical protein NTW49_06000 [Bacteroidia bacterium]|nr:hypothetical protein [Bacteroidia bacterium]